MYPRLRSLALAIAVAALLAAQSANAAIVVGLVLDPTTTAGGSGSVNSIYSGLGTWQLFAVDTSDDDFGISSYNVSLTGATTIRHTSPSALAIDGLDGEGYGAGFNLLRTASGAPGSDTLHASQPLPDRSPYLIPGLGQQSGSFAAVTGGTASGATSPSWGDYSTVSPLNGKNWLFLAEGTYDQAIRPGIAEAAFTVYGNTTTFTSKMASTTIVPDSITSTLLTTEYLARLTPPPPVVQPPAAPIELPPAPPVVGPPSPTENAPPTPGVGSDPPSDVQPPEATTVPPDWTPVDSPGITWQPSIIITLPFRDLIYDYYDDVSQISTDRFIYSLSASGVPVTTFEDRDTSLSYAFSASNLATTDFNSDAASIVFASENSTAETPEPSVLTLAAMGAIGLLASRRRSS